MRTRFRMPCSRIRSSLVETSSPFSFSSAPNARAGGRRRPPAAAAAPRNSRRERVATDRVASIMIDLLSGIDGAILRPATLKNLLAECRTDQFDGQIGGTVVFV